MPRPRKVNEKMDNELRTYQREVEAKYAKSELKGFQFLRVVPSKKAEQIRTVDVDFSKDLSPQQFKNVINTVKNDDSKPPSTASSKDILSQLLVKYN